MKLDLDQREIPCRNWEEAQTVIREIRERFERKWSRLIFRGQGDASWKLETTLERSGFREKSLKAYLHRIDAMRNAIESFSGLRFKLDSDEMQSFRTINDFAERPLLDWSRFPIDLFQYLIYLRHHGCPSPLLDWTQSSAIAAFMACRSHLGKNAPENGAIYVYCETLDGTKAGWHSDSNIKTLGPYVSGHPRHFLQQATYTIALRQDGHQWIIGSHEEAINGRDGNQDVIWKLLLPSQECLEVMKMLDGFNVNDYSLFGTEEALVQTQWNRESFRESLD